MEEDRLKNVNIMITIPKSLKEDLEILAATDCRSRNNLITKILIDFNTSREPIRIMDTANVPFRSGHK